MRRILGVLLAFVGLRCEQSMEDTPEAAAQAFAAAGVRGDSQEVFDLLDAATRRDLERLAARAAEQGGLQAPLAAHEMIAAGLRQSAAPSRVSRLEASGSRAVIRVFGANGMTDDLVLHREDGRWLVHLDIRHLLTSPQR